MRLIDCKIISRVVKHASLTLIFLSLISCSSAKIGFSDIKSYNHILESHNRTFNPDVESYLSRILAKIGCAYDIKLFDSGFFAIYSNNNILVSNKLLCTLENEAQLAFVLAHECAHGQLKHLTEKYSESIEYEADKLACAKLANTDYDIYEATKSISLLAKLNSTEPRKLSCSYQASSVKLVSSTSFKTLVRYCLN